MTENSHARNYFGFGDLRVPATPRRIVFVKAFETWRPLLCRG